MEHNVSSMLKMIKEEISYLANKAGMCEQTRPELISQFEEFYCMYQSVAERYDHLRKELQSTADSESGYPSHSPPLTPDNKLNFKTSHPVASACSSGGSFNHSLKESSGSSTPSSDYEFESINSSGNVYFSLPMDTDRKGLHKKIIESGNEFSNMQQKFKWDAEEKDDGMWSIEQRDYGVSFGNIGRHEEELRALKLRLQLSEDEVCKLKNELRESVSLQELSGALNAQLKSAHKVVKMREADLEVEKRRVLELQKQLADGTNELQGQLELAQEGITTLKDTLDSKSMQVLALQERILRYENDLADRDREVRELNVGLLEAQKNLSMQKAHLESDISNLSSKQKLLEARSREWELQCKSFEDKLTQCEAEKMKMKDLYDTLEFGMQKEISQLKSELIERGGHAEVLNKNYDSLKLKYDMLMAEKDGMNAKVSTLIADVSCRDYQIRQQEENLEKLNIEHMELVVGSERERKLVDELKGRVVKLEKEVDRQRVEISAGAEEKREAIRQLCFSLDHYRSGYKQLCQALLGSKRHMIMTS